MKYTSLSIHVAWLSAARMCSRRRITEDDARTIVRGRVTGYAKENGVLVRAQFGDVSENLPAGGHLASAEDLVRFAAA